jgi:hypothetical protein
LVSSDFYYHHKLKKIRKSTEKRVAVFSTHPVDVFPFTFSQGNRYVFRLDIKFSGWFEEGEHMEENTFI